MEKDMHEQLPEPTMTEAEADFANLEDMLAEHDNWVSALEILQNLSRGGEHEI